MYLNNEDFIIFITSLSIFKYKVLSFNLINELMFYQQYMNEILFNFLNYFIQVYLNDILIYSKIYREHINHIHSVLNKFQKIDL